MTRDAVFVLGFFIGLTITMAIVYRNAGRKP